MFRFDTENTFAILYICEFGCLGVRTDEKAVGMKSELADWQIVMVLDIK